MAKFDESRILVDETGYNYVKVKRISENIKANYYLDE